MFAAFVVAISMMFQQIEIDSKEKNRITKKGVVLSKSRKEVYEFISNLENLPLVNSIFFFQMNKILTILILKFFQWFPNIKEVYSLDSKSEPSVGKKYRQISTWLFGLGETQTQLTISSVQPLSSIEFYSDNLLKEINHFELAALEANRTRLEWKIYSMRKTLLFKVKYRFNFLNLSLKINKSRKIYLIFALISTQSATAISFTTVNWYAKHCFLFNS